MAEPYRHPETGVYYLRRQIPEPIRIEFGGKALWKRSLNTKDAAEARRVFAAENAELEKLFEQARATVAERTERDRLSPSTAAAMVDRAARSAGGRFAILRHLFWAEECAANMTGLPGAFLTKDDPDQLEALRGRPTLPGEPWLKVIATRSHADAILMAQHPIELVRGLMRVGNDVYPEIARNEFNDSVLTDALTQRIRVELVELREALALPYRRTTSRRRPDLSISQLLHEWKTKRKPSLKAFHEAQTTITDFITFVGGDVLVASISGDTLCDFRDAIAILPRAMPKAGRLLDFHQRLAKYKEHALECVSPTTIKKRIGFLQAMIGMAAGERWIETNPAGRIPIDGYTKSAVKRRPFRDGELHSLFAAPLFTAPSSWTFLRRTVSDTTLAWSFLLGLTSGARLEEIGQTLLINIKTDNATRYFDLGRDATVKNEVSHRTIPLHDFILDLGFENYVSALKSAGATRLFPDLKPGKFDQLCHDASTLANRLIDRSVANDPLLVFHSLRHTFKDLARDKKIEKYIIDQIVGHAGITAGDNYGFGARIQALKEELDRLRFSMIDWGPIVAAFTAVDWNDVARKLVIFRD